MKHQPLPIIKIIQVGTVAFLAILAGCEVSTEMQWKQVTELNEQRTGRNLIWEQTDEDRIIINESIETLLEDGLTREEAVSIAILNNRELQAGFEELGIAASDLLQSQLLTNPPLAGFLALPTNVGNTTASLLFVISDLWQIPARKKLFESLSDIKAQQVTMLIVQTAAEAEMAYDHAVYREKMLMLAERMQQEKQLIADRMFVRYRHGLIGELVLERARADAAQQRIVVRNMQNLLQIAETRLDVSLSLHNVAQQVKFTSTLDWMYKSLDDPQKYVDFAMKHRLDILTANTEVQAAKLAMEYQKTLLFPSMQAGFAWEGAIQNENTFGPAGSMVVPIFDQNQAQVAKAMYVHKQKKKYLQSLENKTRKQVMDIIYNQNTEQDNLKYLYNQLNRIIENEVEYADNWRMKRQLNMIDWLTARVMHIMLDQQMVDTIWRLRMQQVELYQASWGGMTTEPSPAQIPVMPADGIVEIDDGPTF
ncbi:TolC family protein [Poriferisphaera sp. WC338]|uniref:TolC family protein n=1 Tax=Poriferisphaera sp. WC338 TaxID=3425129 RepID=UPI003D81C2EB